jgi:hypothetical protein
MGFSNHALEKFVNYAFGVDQAYLVKLDESGVAADIEKDKKDLLCLHRSQFLNAMLICISPVATARSQHIG